MIRKKLITIGSWRTSAPPRRSRPRGMTTVTFSAVPRSTVMQKCSSKPWPTRWSGCGAATMRSDRERQASGGCPMTAHRTLKIAGIQVESRNFDVDGNLQRAEELVAVAATRGAELVLCPELLAA